MDLFGSRRVLYGSIGEQESFVWIYWGAGEFCMDLLGSRRVLYGSIGEQESFVWIYWGAGEFCSKFGASGSRTDFVLERWVHIRLHLRGPNSMHGVKVYALILIVISKNYRK